MTQPELADLAGCSRARIAQIEAGKDSSLDLWFTILDVLSKKIPRGADPKLDSFRSLVEGRMPIKKASSLFDRAVAALAALNDDEINALLPILELAASRSSSSTSGTGS